MTKLKMALVLILIVFFSGCASLSALFGKKDSDQTVLSGPYYDAEHSGEGLRLAILRPESENVSEAFEYLPDIIQGSLSEDFSKFSAITIIDRQNLDRILAEQNISLSGNFSEDTEIKIGNLTFQQYVLFGKLTGIPGGYLLHLKITELSTSEEKAVYDKQLTAREIKSGAIKNASLNLLEKMEVELTPNGKSALEAAAQAGAAAQTNLAMSRAAGRKGNTVEELIYAYGAVDRNASIAGAAAQLNAVAAEMSSGGLGLNIRNDVEQRNWWKTQMTGFETYYDEHTPFELVYTPVPLERGINYDAETADFEFTVSLQPAGEIPVMQKVLRDILKGLNKTRNRKKWKFNEWPGVILQSNVFRDKKYSIEAGLFNDSDEMIRAVSFNLYSQLAFKSNTVYFDSTQRLPVVFAGINVNDLTGDMKIRLLNINGMKADDAEETGYWHISAVDQKRVPARRVTIPEKDRVIPHPEIVKKTPPPAPEKIKPAAPPPSSRESLPLDYRFGISGSGLFSPIAGLDTAAAGLTFDVGIKSFTAEVILLWPVNAALYNAPGLDDMKIFGIGGGAGYTLVTRHLLSTLSLGMIYTGFQNDEKVFSPYGQLKFDIMPWEIGLGLRLGFMAEFGALDWGDAYQRYYSDAWAFNAGGSYRINGRIMTGLILWL